ncbi:MAG TPA: ribosome maturation factor RimM [Rhodanobacteraceae bacterium]|jgi:16S rRNA processing protein RimM|nr:ribosome maturation factor RimM [Rhodanobacteraceae bacterium]
MEIFDEGTRSGYVLLGRIVGVHGVHGAVKLESFTEPRLAIFNYKPWLLERESGQFEEVAEAHGHAQGKGMVATLAGVGDRDAAAAWIGARIWIPRDALPEPEAGEYYQTDLEGLQVLNTAGELLGTVSHLFDNGAHDVLMVRDAAGRERLVPYVADRYVKSVDLDAGRIVVDWDKDD